MKRLKRIFGLILAIIMLLDISVVSYAANSQDSTGLDGIETLSDGSYILRGSNWYLRSYDLENGDSVFEEYTNGELISKCISHKGQNKISAFYYDTNESVTIHLPRAKEAAARGTTSGRLGRIRYQYTSGSGTGICGAYVNYTKNTGSIKYDVNGTYRNVATFASALATLLYLPASVASSLAGSILTYFGIASTTVGFLIPQYKLQSNYEEIEYKLTDMDMASHQNTFHGAKYTITESGSHLNKVYTEGTYYPTSAWGTQNFGTTIYSFLFYYSAWKIYAWN